MAFAASGGAAASDGDDYVPFRRGTNPRTLANHCNSRFSRDRIDDTLKAGIFESLPNRSYTGRVSTRDEQRSVTKLLGESRQLRHRAGSEDDPCGRRKLEMHQKSLSAGKRLTSGTLERGSAIMSTTASRHLR
jgi:hypothetical protein